MKLLRQNIGLPEVSHSGRGGVIVATLPSRATNEGLQRIHNHGEGPLVGPSPG